MKETTGDRLLEKITCPHCWHEFTPEEFLWIAKHQELRGDPVLGPEKPTRFRPTRFNVGCEALDARGLACQQLACPRCHLSIPRVFAYSEPTIFSLIGIEASGKSYLLAAMTWELRRVLPKRFELVFSDADPLGNVIITENENTLFRQGDPARMVTIAKTQMESAHYDEVNLDGQSVRLPAPLLFHLQPTGRHPQARLRRSHVICLYDNAGEHFQPGMDTAEAPGTQHLARSRVLMFLYDPTQDPGFRERCRAVSKDPQLSSTVPRWRQDVIFTEAAQRVRQYGGLAPHEHLHRPLIVLVSKADVWGPLLGEDLSTEPYARKPGAATDTLDRARVDHVSSRLRALLLDLTPEFVAAVEGTCSKVVYVPVSALGSSPEMHEATKVLSVRPRNVAPRWVTVPFVYAFARWSKGVIAGGAACRA